MRFGDTRRYTQIMLKWETEKDKTSKTAFCKKYGISTTLFNKAQLWWEQEGKLKYTDDEKLKAYIEDLKGYINKFEESLNKASDMQKEPFSNEELINGIKDVLKRSGGKLKVVLPDFIITKNKNGSNIDITVKPLNKFNSEFGLIMQQINGLSKTVLEYKTRLLELEGLYKQVLNVESENVNTSLVYVNKTIGEKDWDKLIKQLKK